MKKGSDFSEPLILLYVDDPSFLEFNIHLDGKVIAYYVTAFVCDS